jgi:pimeloyl-ACP methyl ester carboxylesterase
MRRALRRRGFAQVCTWNYSPLQRDVQSAAEALGRHIEHICRETGHERVHVVGHSLGGLVARYLVQRLGGDERVQSLVTLGTPHAGTRLARALPTPLVRQLRPGSALMQELAEPVPSCRTLITAVYSDLDQVVVPSAAGRCDHPDLQARNVLMRGVGHMSLPIHRGVVDEVAATFAGLRGRAAGPSAAAA